MPNGQPCGSFAFCDTDPTGDICEAQLRDTDHDGLRDDIEVYGYSTDATQMPRYGANPVHKDVFIEMDTLDRDLGVAGCQGFTFGGDPAQDVRLLGDGPDVATSHFFDRFQEIYGTAPASMNPDGLPGIAFHFDVGVENPDPSDTRWGDWGGSTCILDDGVQYYVHAETAFTTARSWLFRWAQDGPGDDGGQTSYGRVYAASSLATHVHEVGHTLLLDHNGPIHAAANHGADGNRRPLYPSRMNYRFNRYGGSSADASGVDWTSLTFSSGQWNRQMSLRTAYEDDPVGQVMEPLEFGGPAENVMGTDLHDVDWDLDESIDSPNPVTHVASLRSHDTRRARSAVNHDQGTGVFGTHSDLNVVGSLLVHAYVANVDSSLGPVPFTYLASEGDAFCPVRPNAPTGEAQARYDYTPCLPFGEPVAVSSSAVGVSAAATELSSSKDGLLLVERVGTDLRALEMAIEPSTGPAAATYNLVSASTINGPPADDDIVLVEMAHGGVLGLYESDGLLLQTYRPEGTVYWQTVLKAQIDTGGDFGDPGTLPGLALHDGSTYLVARRGSGPLHVYKLKVTIDDENEWPWTDLGPVPETDDAIDVEASSRPAPNGTILNEFHIFFRHVDDTVYGLRTVDFSNYTPKKNETGNGDDRGRHAAAAFYDDRGTTPGLRLVRDLYSPNCSVELDGEGEIIEDSCDGSPAPRPSDLECNASQLCSSDVLGGETGWLRHFPFVSGLDPTEFCDYDDWRGISWGICEALSYADRPTHTNDFVRTPYELPVVCRPRPVFQEPDAYGSCGANNLIIAPAADDRTTYPELYEEPGEVVCE